MSISFDRLLSETPLASSATPGHADPMKVSRLTAPANRDKFEGQFGGKASRGNRSAKGAPKKAGLSRLLKEGVSMKRTSVRSGFGTDFRDLRQRATVKLHYYNHARRGGAGGGGGGGGMKAHTRYLARDAAGRDDLENPTREASLEIDLHTPEAEARAHSQYLSRGERGPSPFYDAHEVGIDGAARAEAWAKSDRRHFRLILSAEEGGSLRDLTAYTREVMERAGAQLGTELQWIAVDHHDTAHPHTHIILRGRRANGQDLIIPKDFIQHGFRNIARDVATEWLGRRTPNQERDALDREALRHGPTRLDRIIEAQLPENNEIRLSRLRSLDGDSHVTRVLKARAKELERLGFASEVKRGVLRFEADWLERLKSLELHLDISKSRMAERQLQQRLEQERQVKRLSRGLER